jgi:hypothetical protein
MTQHIHEPPTVVHETREVHDSTDSGMGLGMVLGIVLAIGLAVGLLWFMLGARMMGNNTVVPGTGDTTIDVQPPNVNIDKPNVTINPPAQPQGGSGQ